MDINHLHNIFWRLVVEVIGLEHMDAISQCAEDFVTRLVEKEFSRGDAILKQNTKHQEGQRIGGRNAQNVGVRDDRSRYHQASQHTICFLYVHNQTALTHCSKSQSCACAMTQLPKSALSRQKQQVVSLAWPRHCQL